MVVDRGHQKDAFFAEFETADLQDDRDGFDDEDEPDEQQQQFAFGDDTEVADEGPDGERTAVAHEDLRRVGVEP